MNTATLKLKELVNQKKKQLAQVKALEEESKSALGVTKRFYNPEYKPNEICTLAETTSKKSEKVQHLDAFIREWINDFLLTKHIVVKDLVEDLKDGYILLEIANTITNQVADPADVPDLTMSKLLQMSRINKTFILMSEFDSNFQKKLEGSPFVTQTGVFQGNLAAILRLMVIIIQLAEPGIALPPDVVLKMLVCQVDSLSYEIQDFRMTDKEQEISSDGIQTEEFSLELLHYVNSKLVLLDLEATKIDQDFRNGVRLIYLLGLLGNFFVPFHFFHQNPQTENEKRTNLRLVSDLLSDSDIQFALTDQQDVQKGDPLATKRIIFAIKNYFEEIN
ncbi:hypothetical protein Ciccas_002122 [Cichlidogyrus casuarinus]|uniref:Calponin-homology (CH) domain-containing protein n=1 Tax=Cichlidogyrus casuarinus TaxID=1844966 RepID=A0ABD2QI56_9PLAT